MEIKELQDIIQQNGVVGAGGAGFPTYMKLTDKANTILMNCAECEPLLKLHRQLLEKHAYEIMKTFHMNGIGLVCKLHISRESGSAGTYHTILLYNIL